MVAGHMVEKKKSGAAPYNEKAAWDKLDAAKKSFVIRVLNWFHFRPGQLAESWEREEVLTWELFRAFEVLPRRLFLFPLLDLISQRNASCAGLVSHLQSAGGSLQIDAYPLMRLTGSKRNRRSDIGIAHPDGTQLWLEAKTVILTSKGVEELQQQLQDQQEALEGITGNNSSKVVALVTSRDEADRFPVITWADVLCALESTIADLTALNSDSNDFGGYLLVARELHGRIRGHQNRIV